MGAGAQSGTIQNAIARGYKKVAFIELDIEAVHHCIDYSVALAKKLGVEVVSRGNVAPGAPDCGPQVLAARGAIRMGAALHGEAHNHHHGDELDEHSDAPALSGIDGFVELAGEWEGRQRIGGEVEEASGGKWAYVAPGVRLSAASGWSASAALAVPVWQKIRASHPNNRYRLMLSLGRGF